MFEHITDEVVIAYSLCPYKAYLLICNDKKGICHEYANIISEQKHANQREYLKNLLQSRTDIKPYNIENLKKGCKLLIEATLQTDELEANCASLTQIDVHTYRPTIVLGTNKISKTDRLQLCWVCYVLEQMGIKPPAFGQFIGDDGRTRRVKIDQYKKTIYPIIDALQKFRYAESLTPPPVVLNKHCPLCQFRKICRVEVKQNDDLSLLHGITLKKIRQYEKKGIFTVKQLSYLYKPRKRKKRSKNPPPINHQIELQALSIRDKKIYVKEPPELIRRFPEIFLDIEGTPDKQYYYLIGILVSLVDSMSYHAFWSDDFNDEKKMWQQFVNMVSQFPTVPIYHYGSYESKALVKLTKRYNTECKELVERLVNVNHFIYGKIYFPVYSNSLKELGHFIGATWTSIEASGLQTLVWRFYWEKTHQSNYKKLLLTYNEEDCQALKRLTDELSKIQQLGERLSKVEFVGKQKRHSTEMGKEIHKQLRTILDFSYHDYDKKKIRFREVREKESQVSEQERRRTNAYKLHNKFINTQHKVQKVIQIPPHNRCPKCKKKSLRAYEKTAKRLIVNLVMTRNGIKKTITEFVGTYTYCIRCHCPCPPSFKYNKNQLYGHGFKAWLVYHRVALRLPYESIVESVKEQFNEKIAPPFIPKAVRSFADYYAETERGITQHLLQSPFIHADETKINIMGVNWYVWVFTNIQYVFFKLQETREATFVNELLAEYKGILVSDFYPGYDSAPCRQQKCWAHLIKDLNNDLWGAPFDIEFGKLVLEIKNLILPIMECIHKYGLKRRHLRKFKRDVEKFYKHSIVDIYYNSDLAIKYQKRFLRYQDSLFTFLEYDGICWHNNPAEWAIRAIAKQRAISTSFSAETIENYLVLLGIRQTCRAQNKSFFKFLFSEEKNIDRFEIRKRKKLYYNY